MKLSIITTVYQSEKDLPRLFESMTALKSPELEFFIINNGSTDGSAKICDTYAKKDSRFRIHTLEKNIGYIGARNLGLKLVDADYIGFCDSDDYLESGGYDKVIELLKAEPCDLYIGAWNKVTSDKHIQKLNSSLQNGRYTGAKIESELYPSFWGFYNSRPMHLGFMWKQVFRLDTIRKARIEFNETLIPCDDLLFNASMILKCNSVIVDNDNILYNYVVNVQSITARMQADINIEKEATLTKNLFERLNEIAPDKICQTALANHILKYICTIISRGSRSSKDNIAKSIAFHFNKVFTDRIVKESRPESYIYKILRLGIKCRAFSWMLFGFKHLYKRK